MSSRLSTMGGLGAVRLVASQTSPALALAAASTSTTNESGREFTRSCWKTRRHASLWRGRTGATSMGETIGGLRRSPTRECAAPLSCSRRLGDPRQLENKVILLLKGGPSEFNSGEVPSTSYNFTSSTSASRRVWASVQHHYDYFFRNFRHLQK